MVTKRLEAKLSSVLPDLVGIRAHRAWKRSGTLRRFGALTHEVVRSCMI